MKIPVTMMTMEDIKEQLDEVEDIRAIAFRMVLTKYGVDLDLETVKTLMDESYKLFVELSDDENFNGKVH